MMNIVDIFKLAGKNLDKIAIGVLIIFCCFFYFKTRAIEAREVESRIAAQNEIARLSSVVNEYEGTWSRLAQQSDNTEQMLELLGETVPRLSELIESRNEEIATLTTAIANVRPIRVVVDANQATQSVEPPVSSSDPERLRVDFDTIWQDLIRIHGHTMTNPAMADVSVDFVRPINFTVVTTQAEDLSWRTYIESDWPDLQIGAIESRVNPVARPSENRRWEQDISISLLGGASVTGNAGIFGTELSYDFGPIDIGIFAGGITYLGATDFLVGGRVGLAPFDL